MYIKPSKLVPQISQRCNHGTLWTEHSITNHTNSLIDIKQVVEHMVILSLKYSYIQEKK